MLRVIMLRDSNPGLQAQAALSLGRTGDRASADALNVALAHSRSAAFTEVVTESLGLIAHRP